jgi:hypothetical protein
VSFSLHSVDRHRHHASQNDTNFMLRPTLSLRIEIHRDELMANWRLALNGEEVFRIEPLK